jgi:CSLREA domain-containing protein
MNLRFTNLLKSLTLAIVFLTAGFSSVNAATFVVNTTADTIDATAGDGNCADAGGACSLRAAISEANALAGDDIINIPAGTYTQTLVGSDNTNAAGDWDVTSNITINGAGAATTILQANVAPNVSVERVIHFVTGGTSTVSGVTFRNGRTTSGIFGGGVRVESAVNVTLNNVIIRDNIALGRGGGLYVVTSTSVLTMNNSTITNNQSSTNGVGTTSAGGAGVYQLAGNSTFNNTNINGNTTDVTGSTAGAPPNAVGGGVTVVGGTLNLNFSTVNNNTATSTQSSAFGGGINMAGTTAAVNLTNSSVNNNTATIPAGTGFPNVGGINNEGGTLTLNNSTVSGNTAGSSGGIRVLASTVAATANINRSAIVNNTATGSAGGIFTISIGTAAATTNLNNSTVGGNAANSDGGGILNYATSTGNATTSVNYSTVASNRADADNNATGNGGGLANFGNITMGQTGLGLIFLQSSIVADNTSGTNMSPDIVNTITSQGYNHVENTTGGTLTFSARGASVLGVGDVTGTDPGLTPLALNGGSTLNYLPAGGSPVIDTIPVGTNGCGTAPFNVEQRGIPRPQGAACDKGAVEAVVLSAAASISGRVATADGAGIRNAVITVTGGNLAQPIYVRTGSLGYYNIEGLDVGETYVLTVNSKRFTFSVPSRVITLNENVDDADFIAE